MQLKRGLFPIAVLLLCLGSAEEVFADCPWGFVPQYDAATHETVCVMGYQPPAGGTTVNPATGTSGTAAQDEAARKAASEAAKAEAEAKKAAAAQAKAEKEAARKAAAEAAKAEAEAKKAAAAQAKAEKEAARKAAAEAAKAEAEAKKAAAAQAKAEKEAARKAAAEAAKAEAEAKKAAAAQAKAEKEAARKAAAEAAKAEAEAKKAAAAQTSVLQSSNPLIKKVAEELAKAEAETKKLEAERQKLETSVELAEEKAEKAEVNARKKMGYPDFIAQNPVIPMVNKTKFVIAKEEKAAAMKTVAQATRSAADARYAELSQRADAGDQKARDELLLSEYEARKAEVEARNAGLEAEIAMLGVRKSDAEERLALALSGKVPALEHSHVEGLQNNPDDGFPTVAENTIVEPDSEGSGQTVDEGLPQSDGLDTEPEVNVPARDAVSLGKDINAIIADPHRGQMRFSIGLGFTFPGFMDLDFSFGYRFFEHFGLYTNLDAAGIFSETFAIRWEVVPAFVVDRGIFMFTLGCGLGILYESEYFVSYDSEYPNYSFVVEPQMRFDFHLSDSFLMGGGLSWYVGIGTRVPIGVSLTLNLTYMFNLKNRLQENREADNESN